MPVEDTPAAPAPAAGRGLTAGTALATVGLQVAARGLSLLIAVAITAVVARAFGVTGFADWATVMTVVAMLGFSLDPGFTPVIVRRLVQSPQRCPSMRALLFVRLASAAVAVVVAVGLGVGLRGTEAATLTLVLAAQLVPRAVVLHASALLQVDHRQHRQSFAEVATGAAGLVALVACDQAGASPPVLALVAITLPLVALAAISVRLALASPSAGRLVPGDDRARTASLLRETAPIALALVLWSLYMRIQVVFVNASETERGIAEYLLAFLFVEQLLVLGGIAGAALMPFFADRSSARSLFGDDLTQTVLIALGAVGAIVGGALVVVSEPLVDVLGGEDLSGASAILVLLSPMAPAALVAVPVAYVYTAAKQTARYVRFNLVGLVLALILNAALTLSLGGPAAARVTWITEYAVIACALAPVWRAGGREATVRLGLLGLASVAAAEGVAAGLPVLAGFGLVTLAAVALARRSVSTLVRTRILARSS